jgi:hypothetical protein
LFACLLACLFCWLVLCACLLVCFLGGISADTFFGIRRGIRGAFLHFRSRTTPNTQQ